MDRRGCESCCSVTPATCNKRHGRGAWRTCRLGPAGPLMVRWQAEWTDERVSARVNEWRNAPQYTPSSPEPPPPCAKWCTVSGLCWRCRHRWRARSKLNKVPLCGPDHLCHFPSCLRVSPRCKMFHALQDCSGGKLLDFCTLCGK